MEPVKILLVDCNPSGGLCSELRQNLGSELRVRNVKDANLIQVLSHPLNHQRLAAEISELNPGMLLVIPPIQSTDQVNSLIRFAVEQSPGIQIILLSNDFSRDELFEFARSSISQFIFREQMKEAVVSSRHRKRSQFGSLEEPAEEFKQALALGQLIGESSDFVAEIRKIPIFAKLDVSVLISGETGTGKELVARSIHYLSARASKPFLPLNCGAVPAELLENELFGHKQGAYTSAMSSEPGILIGAEGGTLFLDEIDSLPLHAQVKLLRLLQEKEFRPLGSAKSYKSDVRIVAATSIDLREAIATGKFRGDLYYRLNVIAVDLPPLRERQTDIPLLARHFLVKYAEQFNRRVENFSVDALQTLMLYDWPGNVRELEHVVTRAVVLSDSATIEKVALDLPTADPLPNREGFQKAKNKLIAEFEKSYIRALLTSFQGNVTKAAQAAQKDRRSFWQLVRKHDINVQSFRTARHNVDSLPH